MPGPTGHDDILRTYLADCRSEVLQELSDRLPPDTPMTGGLYGLMLDYPMRPAKALRPALAMALCRLHGGSADAILPTAAALELYHNAFLIHDDVEDGSELRRGAPTLHLAHGVPVAMNVGDGMLAVAMRTLTENVRHLGLARALDILDAVTEMAIQTAEGQAVELDWIARQRWELRDQDYLRMVYKKSTHYSFITPIRVGCIAAGVPVGERRAWERFGAMVGIAFQIQDDVLNLAGSVEVYGKEIGGDLAEGKRTTILLHALRTASPAQRSDALRALARPRPARTEKDIHLLRDLIDRSGALNHARDLASRHCRRADLLLRRLSAGRTPSPHQRFLAALVQYVLHRDR